MEIRAKRIKKFSDFLNNANKRIVILYGGAGSGKSYSIAQHLIKKLYTERNKSFLITRKTLPSLRISAFKLIKKLLDQYRLPYHLNKSDLLISACGNEMMFKGLDDIDKVKSAEGINYVWPEEATDFKSGEIESLNMRFGREETEILNQMFLSFNPVSLFHWIKKEFFDVVRDDCAILHSTYKDNPFLPQAYIDMLTKLKERDLTLWKIYAQGLWAELKNIIYSQLTHYEVMGNWPQDFDETIYGLDFGFNNPSALLEINYLDNVPYERELLYETGLTNGELIKQMEILIPNPKTPIYADSSEPARIQEIEDAGFNVYPAAKGPGSVKAGIDHCKTGKTYIHEESSNLIAEKGSYKWREDRQGSAQDEPVKWMDHLMDAERMARWTHSLEVGGVSEGDVHFG